MFATYPATRSSMQKSKVSSALALTCSTTWATVSRARTLATNLLHIVTLFGDSLSFLQIIIKIQIVLNLFCFMKVDLVVLRLMLISG